MSNEQNEDKGGTLYSDLPEKERSRIRSEVVDILNEWDIMNVLSITVMNTRRLSLITRTIAELTAKHDPKVNIAPEHFHSAISEITDSSVLREVAEGGVNLQELLDQSQEHIPVFVKYAMVVLGELDIEDVPELAVGDKPPQETETEEHTEGDTDVSEQNDDTDRED